MSCWPPKRSFLSRSIPKRCRRQTCIYLCYVHQHRTTWSILLSGNIFRSLNIPYSSLRVNCSSLVKLTPDYCMISIGKRLWTLHGKILLFGNTSICRRERINWKRLWSSSIAFRLYVLILNLHLVGIGAFLGVFYRFGDSGCFHINPPNSVI